MTSQIAEIGDNNPPEDEFTLISREISDNYDEAKNWLDGDAIASQDIAAGIVTLMRELQRQGKAAEALRKEEKQPHLDASREVDAKFKPLAEVVKRAVDACKTTLAPWEKQKRDAKEAADREARRIAAEEEAKAVAARQAAAGNIAEREVADANLEAAISASKKAKWESSKSAGTKVSGSRAVGLRTDYIPTLVDTLAAVSHYFDRPEIADVLLQMAKQDIRAGERKIPGFTIETKETVI